MYDKQSEISLMDAIDIALHNYNPIKIYYNNKLIWDDTLSLDEGWMTPNKAIEKFKLEHKWWDHIVVNSIKINIVEWHHSVVNLKGYERCG